MDNGTLSRGLSGRNVVLTIHPPCSAEVKERVELYLYSLLWAFMACFRANFALIVFICVIVVQ
jgi:hypothetical protein